jgi:ABC-type glycerol-3-phosphate transport system substrate-binding protein
MENIIKDKKKKKIMLKKTRICLLFFGLITVSAFFLASVLSSCGLFEKNVSDETSESAETQETASETSAQEETVTITDLDIWTKIEPQQQVELTNSIEIFTGMNPEIKTTTRNFRSNEELIDQFTAASLAGAGADLIITEIGSLEDLARAGVIKPLEPELSNTDILKGPAEMSYFDGKMYALPFRAFDFLMLFYNREFMEEPPGDFDALIEYCKQVNKPSEQLWGFLLNWKEPEWVLPFCGGFGDWIYDYDSGSIFLDSEAMTETLRFLDDIYNVRKTLPLEVEYEDINTAFINKTAHMVINGNWAVEEYIKAGLDFGTAQIPVAPGGFKNPTPMINCTGFMFNINSYGARYEAAKEFAGFLLSEEMQISWTERTQTLPVLKSLTGNTAITADPVLFNQFKQAIICRGKVPEDALRVIIDSMRLNIENVMYGNLSPEDAAKKMQEDAIKLSTGLESADGTTETGSNQN